MDFDKRMILQQADVIAPSVHAVVEAPGGAWPTSCHPLYPLDGLAFLRTTDVTETPEKAALLAEWTDRRPSGRAGSNSHLVLKVVC